MSRYEEDELVGCREGLTGPLQINASMQLRVRSETSVRCCVIHLRIFIGPHTLFLRILQLITLLMPLRVSFLYSPTALHQISGQAQR